MIDISQIVSTAASTAASSRSANNANNNATQSRGFGDALARASNNNSDASAPASRKAGNSAAASSSPAQTTQATQGSTVAAKPSRRQDKDGDQGQEAAADPTAQSAAAALAAQASLKDLKDPAQATTAAATPASSAATDTPATIGSQRAVLQAVPQSASITEAATAANGARPAAAGLPGGAAALGAQASLKDLKDPAQANTAADTLATIDSQRAVLQAVSQSAAGTHAATTDKAATPAGEASKANPDPAASLTAAMAGQQAGKGQPGAGQQDASAGQQYKTPLQIGEAGKGDQLQAPAAAAPANPMPLSAAMRAAEPASTEVAPAGAAAMPAMAASTMAAGQAPTAGGLSPATSLPIAPPVGDGQWPQALGQQMVRLSTQGNHTAELQLNPPDLGPLKVVLNVVNDQAQAQFVSPHAAVRAAVEAALPQLRTALADNGIQLGQTSVGADSFAGQAGNGQQQQRQPGSPQHGFGTLAGTAAAQVNAGPTAPVARTLARGEVDTFA